jgi:hypothetical protein
MKTLHKRLKDIIQSIKGLSEIDAIKKMENFDLIEANHCFQVVFNKQIPIDKIKY